MIVDKLENLGRYYVLFPYLKDVATFLEHNNLLELPAGHHPIKGEDVFVNVQNIPGKTKDEAVLEFHRRMVDIQMPLNVAETYGYTPVADLPPCDFDASADYGFAHGVSHLCYVTCTPGMFVIFTPDDAHAPCISETKELKKVIFKIKA